LDKKLLKFIDDEQDSRARRATICRARRLPKSGQILDAGGAKHIAATLQFCVQSLQYAQAKFAFALDGDDTCVRQHVRHVRFEFDAFLEIDQKKLDLLGTVMQCEICDQRVEQRGLAGPGLTRDKDMLGRPASEL